LAVNPTEP
jgi:hypothetical protein